MFKRAITGLMLIVVMFSLAGCGGVDKKDQELINSINTMTNFQAVMTMTSGTKSQEITMKVAGKTVWMNGFSDPSLAELLGNDIYAEVLDGSSVLYFQVLTVWTKITIPVDITEADDSDIMDLIKFDDFELKDGKYVLKAEKQAEYQTADLPVITITDNRATLTIEWTISEEGVDVSYKYVISQVGQITVTIPDEVKENAVEFQFPAL